MLKRILVFLAAMLLAAPAAFAQMGAPAANDADAALLKGNPWVEKIQANGVLRVGFDTFRPWARLSLLVRESPPFFQALLEIISVSSRQFGLFFPAVFALGLYEGAYFAEIFRGAIISVEKSQWEAAFCLGLSRVQEYRFVILPQVFRKSAPQLAGQFISTVKESSVVSVISLAELTYSGQQLSATIHKPFEVWLTVAALYCILNALLCRLLSCLEKQGYG